MHLGVDGQEVRCVRGLLICNTEWPTASWQIFANEYTSGISMMTTTMRLDTLRFEYAINENYISYIHVLGRHFAGYGGAVSTYYVQYCVLLYLCLLEARGVSTAGLLKRVSHNLLLVPL